MAKHSKIIEHMRGLFLFLFLKFFSLQVVDGVHIIIFPKNNSDALLRSFSLLISNGKPSKFAKAIAFSGRLLAKNMLASECMNSYAELLENVLSFPSDVLLPRPINQSQHDAWEWNSFRTLDMPHIENDGAFMRKSSVVHVLEENLYDQFDSGNISNSETENDELTELDWDVLREIESIEEMERVELDEVLNLYDYEFHGLLHSLHCLFYIFYFFIFLGRF